MVDKTKPPFQLHLEPDSPIEVAELTGALAAIARQFEIYALEEALASKSKDARLLVTSVAPGSIDIGFLPDATTMAGMLAPLVPYGKIIGFATKIKGLLDKFKSKPPAGSVTIKDCEDAGAIVAPIANHGGSQTINVHNGNVYNAIIVTSGEDAQKIARNAALAKAEMQFPAAEIHQRVAMIWDALDRAKPRQAGVRNPDKVIIEEVDPKARPVFFEDDFAFLKREMLEGVENPYRKVYFVDVSVSRVAGKVVSYKVIGFHGSDELDEETPDV